MNRNASPHACHIFVCVNDRRGERKSCADGAGAEIREALKSGARARGWEGRVRVSHSGCMGLCARGPNVLVYPRGIWFDAARPGDTESILDEVARLLS